MLLDRSQRRTAHRLGSRSDSAGGRRHGRRARRTSTTRWSCRRRRRHRDRRGVRRRSTTTTSCVRRTAGARGGWSRSSSGSGGSRRLQMDTKPAGPRRRVRPPGDQADGDGQRPVYRLTRGRVGGTWRIGAGWRNPVPICLVEHRGRRTGKLRTTPLVYLRDGDRVVVVASQAGRPHHPLWFRNIEADPEVTVQIRGDRRPMRARTADAARARRSCGPASSTSTATTTPTSRGPTGRSRS